MQAAEQARLRLRRNLGAKRSPDMMPEGPSVSTRGPPECHHSRAPFVGLLWSFGYVSDRRVRVPLLCSPGKLGTNREEEPVLPFNEDTVFGGLRMLSLGHLNRCVGAREC